MNSKLDGYKIPKGIKCAQCGTDIIGASPISGGKPRGFKEGTIVVCYHCSAVLRAVKDGFQKLTDVEINSLDQNSKRILSITIGRIRAL